MPILLKPLLRLSVPVLLLIVSAFGLSKIELLDAGDVQLLKILPYVFFAIALALAHYFNRSRFFSAAVLMALVFWLIQSYLQNPLSDQSTFFLFSSISILPPLALILLLILPERGLWNRYGLISIGITPLLCVVTYLIYGNIADSQHLLLSEYFPLRPFPGYVLPLYPSLWILSLTLTTVILLWHRNGEAEAALCACLLFLFATLAFFDRKLISILMFSGAGLSLIAGLLRSSFEMAYRDDLTGLLGRRAFNEKIRGLGRNYAIAMLDVDHFKKFNDTHGHDVGDEVLKVVAANIADISGGGIPYRYGGEEFVVVFPGRKMSHCIPHLEAVRESISEYSITLRDRAKRPKNPKEGVSKRGNKARRKTVSVTISIGIAQRSDEIAKPESVLKAADQALYRAKDNGRNCLMQ